MKKTVLFLVSVFILNAEARSQAIITDTASTGANYANQQWYSLENGKVGTQAKDNWDIAFEISGFTASILANTQKANFALYRSPFTTGQWASVDTAGINSWPLLYNSDTTWASGAFNQGIDLNNQFDLGWGIYDLNTHYVNGDTCFVIKLSASSYKKLKIDALASSVYTFTYADLDGSNEQTGTIAKSGYTGKNFAYYNLTTNAAVDREPASASWDLTFVKYTTFIPIAYGVTGVLNNKNVKAAQVNNIPDVSGFSDYSGQTFSSAINTIGYDWKTYDFNINGYTVEDSLVYFVKTASNKVWKMVYTGFEGSTTGNFYFTKQLLTTTGIADAGGNFVSGFTVYPNPVAGDDLIIIFSSEQRLDNVHLQVTDLAGQVISSENITLSEGFNKYSRSMDALSSGVYFVSIVSSGYAATQRFIKQ